MNSFCPNFFNHVMNDSYGVYKACCLHVPEFDGNKVSGITIDSSLNDFWNSEKLVQQRVKSIKGEYIEGCDVCYQAEKEGGASLRTDLLKTYQNDPKFIQRVQNARKNNGVMDDFPISVEYRVGNLCNLKCRMCSPQDSDLINNEYKEVRSILDDDNFKSLFPVLESPVNVDLKKYSNDIKENVEEIEIIRFSGGEPLINKSFYELIDFFITSGYSKKLDLRINTNLTKLNEELLYKFKEFKNVNLDFSIDGIESTYEYVRYPMKWSVINKKINLLSDYLKNNQTNISVYANYTVQIYNVIHMLDAIDFFLEKNFVPLLHPVTYPAHLNIKNMPQSLKDEAIEKISNKIDLFNSGKYNLDKTRTTWIVRKLTSLISLIKLESDEKSIKDFLKFTKELDNKRKQDFFSLDTSVSNHFNISI